MTLFSLLSNLLISQLWLVSIATVSSQGFDRLHPHVDIDKKTYCDVCKTTSQVLHDLMNNKEEELALDEAWTQLCSHSHFKEFKDRHKVKDYIKACKHLTDTSEEGHPEMFEMVSKFFEHDATVVEIKSAMCHMMSDACLGQQKKLSEEPLPDGGLSEENLMKMLDISDVKKPQPVRAESVKRHPHSEL